MKNISYKVYNRIVMVLALLFLTELFALFLLSKKVTMLLSHLFHRITKSTTTTIHILAFLFFPGTLIHELAHALMAGILFVPVGTIELFPKIEGNGVKLGSVQIAHTDPFRRFLIGVAPFLFGTLLLLGILFYAAQNNLFTNYLFVIFIAYLVFEIGNTMFSSKKDMEGALELLGVVLFFSIVFYFLGARIPVSPSLLFEQPLVVQVLQKGVLFLLIPLGIDFAIMLLMRFITKRSY